MAKKHVLADLVCDSSGAVLTIESAAGRGPAGAKSLACRYESVEAEPAVVYDHKATLRRLWMSESGELWAISGDGVVHRQANGRWSREKLKWERKAIGLRGADLRAIWGNQSADTWVGGLYGAFFHRRGDIWEALAADPSLGIGCIHGVGSQVYAVGENGIMYHFDGTQWSPIKWPRSETHTVHLNAVYCRSEAEVYLAGWGGSLLVGSAASGWMSLDRFGPETKYYGLAEVNGRMVTLAHNNGFGKRWCRILSFDGDSQEVVRDDLYFQFLRAGVGRACFGHERLGFAIWDGSAWAHRPPDMGALTAR